MVRQLIEETTRSGTRGLAYNFHPGQERAWKSEKAVVAIIAGGRSGKTSFGPLWLHREMLAKGPGDYLVAAPNFPLIDKAAGPEVEHFFARRLGVGEMKRSPMQFVFSESGARAVWGRAPDRQPRILFGHADEPESLEAMSAICLALNSRARHCRCPSVLPSRCCRSRT